MIMIYEEKDQVLENASMQKPKTCKHYVEVIEINIHVKQELEKKIEW